MNQNLAPQSPDSPIHPNHKDMANAIRALSMDAVQQANSGHPGMPMGMADVATVLWGNFLNHHPDVPNWPNRDRFVLSVGHGSMLLYSLLHLSGYSDMTLEEIKQFRQLGAKTCGHPEYGHATGIETTTGPLGQGLGNAVGMALAEQMAAARFGTDLVDQYTYVVVGDGCLMEGIAQESLSFAAHLNLHKLIILFDDNGISIDGPTSISTSEDHIARANALNMDTYSVDGHDPQQIAEAIAHAKTTNRPSFIACKTTIAYGAPKKAGTSSSHGAPLGEEEITGAREALGWDHPAFEIPEPIYRDWQETTQRGRSAYDAWQAHLDGLDVNKREAFEAFIRSDLGEAWQQRIAELIADRIETPVKEATRKSSAQTLAVLTQEVNALIGGSADLTGSNLTKTDALASVTADDYSGRYIYYGIREHAMAAVMNGLSLYGGFIPYGGTFLVFTDYMRGSMRLSALMKQGVIYVMTHDSIGVGEDGPTHQPVEHLASLRAMPDITVFRPADAVETAECWALALAHRDRPSVLALTRQGMAQVRLEATKQNLSARGGYVLHGSEEDQAVIIATGSETSLAVEAYHSLKEQGVHVRVVSMPSMELFFEQSDAYRAQVLGTNLPRIAIEAASSFGWHRIIGEDGTFIGLDGFGTSAPAPEIYHSLGITSNAVVEAVKKVV